MLSFEKLFNMDYTQMNIDTENVVTTDQDSPNPGAGKCFIQYQTESFKFFF